MKKGTSVLLTGLLFLMISATAQANVSPPIRISLDSPTAGAKSGKTYAGKLSIESVEGVVVSDLKLSGEGWSIKSFATSGDLKYSRADQILIPFEIQNTDTTRPLVFSCLINGKPYTKHLDISDHSYTTSHQTRSTKKLPDYLESSLRKNPLDADIQNIPAPPTVERQSESSAKGDTRDQSIRVKGNFSYIREDGYAVGADNMWIKVRDEDTTWDEIIGYGMTDSNGDFDFTVSFDGWENPDVYLEFEAENSVVVVQDFWEFEYSWETPTHDDYTGHFIDFGNLIPGDESSHGAIHISNTVVRAWRYLKYVEGYDLDQIDAIWPDGDNAHYNAVFEEIHISNYRTWMEDTICHEYGHHFMSERVDLNIPDYCNGICDTEGALWDDCGHCLWCEENQEDAFGEGVPNWIADVITRYMHTHYTLGVMYTRSQEELDTCQEDYQYGSPLITEGFVGALLRDIDDYSIEEPNAEGWRDAMGAGTAKIFDCLVSHERETFSAFINDFYNDYPQYREAFWETATFNTFTGLDNTAPGSATNMSGNIPVDGSSSDIELSFSWTKPTDNFSGIKGYSVLLSETPGVAPDYNLDTEYSAGYQTYGSAGTWYLTARAVDRAGNWSNSYSSYGPFTIRPPDPADLAFYDPAGWDYPAFPSTGSSNTVSQAHLPAVLPGNNYNTQWNFFAINTGEAATSTWFDIVAYVDGAFADMDYCQDPIGGDYYDYGISPVNLGQLKVRGGRHTFGVDIDSGGRISETDEFNNTYARQFMWSGYQMTTNTDVTRSAPPPRTGGFSWLPLNGLFAHYNCDGFRINAANWWNAAVVIPSSADDDYDCYLYEAVDSPIDGYYTSIGASRRPAGMMDAVLINNNTLGQESYDVGITNSNNGSEDFLIQQVGLSSNLSFGDSLTLTMAADDYILLDEIYISAENTGPIGLSAVIDPEDGPLYLAWLDKTFTTGSLSDATHQTFTDAAGHARLDFAVPESGYYAIVLYRDNPDQQIMPVTVEIQTSPPDFTPWQPDGWFSCLVPRPTDDGTYTSVPVPEYLVGNESSTYLNMAVENIGLGGVDRLRTRIAMDGVHRTAMVNNSFVGQSQRPYNSSLARNFPGGRHTLTMQTDYEYLIEEASESNNSGGHQYVWSPLEMSDGDTAVRPSPYSRTGGWDLVGHSWYNCDGLRMLHAPSTWWGATVVVPGDTSNVDIRLHEASDSTTDGFAQNLAWSGWGVGQSDYVIVNYNQTEFANFDVGILHNSGEQDYTVHYVSGQYLGWFPVGESSPVYTIAAGEVMELLEYQFNAGHYVIDLDNVSGTVNWGMTLHSTETAFQTKSSSLPDAMAWLNGPGEGESIEFDIPIEGYYCLAVWKNETSDVANSGQFQLQFRDLLTPVPETELPSPTGLTGITPNPFNPQTTISFNLASEGNVQLEIYDLRGKLARSLVRDAYSAGRHEVIWNGKDNGGHRLPSGVYMVRMSAHGTNEIQKVLMLK